jgi:hypothetical protein
MKGYLPSRLSQNSFPALYRSERMNNQYEVMARKYIEGAGGLFDLYRHEMASPLYQPKEVEGAAWILKCLTNPENRADLESLIAQSKFRSQEISNDK